MNIDLMSYFYNPKIVDSNFLSKMFPIQAPLDQQSNKVKNEQDTLILVSSPAILSL